MAGRRCKAATAVVRTLRRRGAPGPPRAGAEFVRSFRRRELPEDAQEVPVRFQNESATVDFTELLVSAGVVTSRSEVRRLAAQGAIEVDGIRTTELQPTVRR